MKKIAVLCSGGGTNLQALFDAQDAGILTAGSIVLVLASTPAAYALTRAEERGVPTAVCARSAFDTATERDEQIKALLWQHNIDLVVLAGYLGIVGKAVLGAYPNRVINVHPSLIPSFCGKGYYGLQVHRAALEYGVKVTGATVHFVSEIIDGGQIILQKAVEVLRGDTPEALQKRVMEQAEWVLLPQAVELFCTGQLPGSL